MVGSVRSDGSGYHTPEEGGPTTKTEGSVSFAAQEEAEEEAPQTYGYAKRCFRKYPRCYAIAFGIVVPVWILVGLALLCGKFLGELESPGELEANDAAMRRRRMNRMIKDGAQDTTNSLPTACYMLYQNGTEIERLDETFEAIIEDAGSLSGWIQQQPSISGTSVVNGTKFTNFMAQCGRAADEHAEEMNGRWFADITVDPDGDRSLSFNWNRCMNSTSTNTSNRIFAPTPTQILESSPANQSQAYVYEWNQHFDELRDKYIDVYLQLANGSRFDTKDIRMRAVNRSLYEATGSTTCVVNVPASAWFWFTIMTTVGYGNQAPSSVGGRAMVYTAGFLCILFFGAVLAIAGTIISYIVFDIVHRLKMKLLTRKSVMMLIWGSLWIGWMLLMSAHFIQWAKWRLNQTISLSDAFWFAYISTTTVGLGDYYQMPQVLFLNDLFVFSLSYLMGFLLLSSFLAELGQMLGNNCPDIAEELGTRLKEVGVTDLVEGGLEGTREPLSEHPESDEPETSPPPPSNQNEQPDDIEAKAASGEKVDGPETSPFSNQNEHPDDIEAKAASGECLPAKAEGDDADSANWSSTDGFKIKVKNEHDEVEVKA